MFPTPLFSKTPRYLHEHIYRGRLIRFSRHHKATGILFAGFFLTALVLFFAGKSHAADSLVQVSDPYVIDDKTYYQIPSNNGFIQKGEASWYGPPFHGRKTSNGECYDMHSLTAAHKTLPMDTVLLVKNLENGKTTFVRVNDRGPFVGGRIIDLSYKAAKTLGVVGNGTARVQIVALAEGQVKNEGETPTLYYKDFDVGEFYVQIGSFTKKNNAERLQKRFVAAGHTTVIHQSLKPGDLLYRVRVYVGDTLQRAKIAKDSLLQRGYSGAFVIAR